MPYRTLFLRTLPALLVLPLLAGGCVTIRAVEDGVARARLGETARGGPVTVVPVRVIEDSRCPPTVECIRAGTVRIEARVGDEPRELALGVPIAAAGGALTLVETYPPARAGFTRYPDEYRFGFRWDKARPDPAAAQR